MPEEQMPQEVAPQEQMPQGGEMGPEEQIMMMAEEIVGQLGPEAAMMLAEAIAMMVQGGGEGGGEPMPQEAPAYARRGGKLVPIR
jgi:hypothetical protein